MKKKLKFKMIILCKEKMSNITYKIYKSSDGKLVAQENTLWIFRFRNCNQIIWKATKPKEMIEICKQFMTETKDEELKRKIQTFIDDFLMKYNTNDFVGIFE